MGIRRPRHHRAALSLVLACLLAGAAPADPAPEPLDHYPSGSVTIESGGHRHAFKVWIASTEPRRNQGLMYVKSLAATRGMLFVFDAPQVTSFWMKNTLIPLDLMFIAADGRIIRIAENATPLSEAGISSMGVVATVLEVAGGTAHRLGIAAGDHVRYAPFGSN
ncbi:MAG TPA: DUF192 domain-containing protein [Steroidobacteraceae bacterium]|nr:DUF192 domain-containing protein [Steroidobacteraceae bacterium]